MAVPPVLAREYALPTGTVSGGFQRRVADKELAADARAAHVDAAAEIGAAQRVINQEDAALDHCLAKIQRQPGQRRFQLRARQIQRAARSARQSGATPRVP